MGEVTEAKQIDFKTGKFVANGKNYHISQTFTIERFAIYQSLQAELGYGTDFESIFKKIDAAIARLNEMKLVDAIVILTDIQRGMAHMEEKEPFVLKICALAFNLEGEDVRNITDDQITNKINDWKEEGIDIRCFFQFALNTLNGFSENYVKITQSILQMAQESVI